MPEKFDINEHFAKCPFVKTVNENGEEVWDECRFSNMEMAFYEKVQKFCHACLMGQIVENLNENLEIVDTNGEGTSATMFC